MKNTKSLNGDDWVLEGFPSNMLYVREHFDRGISADPFLPAVKASVPGSVHDDLLRAGMICDWNYELNGLKNEWIENRQWRYRKQFTVPDSWDCKKIYLNAMGLDHSGFIRINEQLVGYFEGSLKKHIIDITKFVLPGEEYSISVVFDEVPKINGSFGFSSQIKEIKPRYGYSWDWCVRMVNVGIWDNIFLSAKSEKHIEEFFVNTDLEDDLTSGKINFGGQVCGIERGEKLYFNIEIFDVYGKTVVNGVFKANENINFHISVPNVEPWWPLGFGPQNRYRLKTQLVSKDGKVYDELQRLVGFKNVKWMSNENSPKNAAPYTLEINDKKIFIKGVNWVPLHPFYGSVKFHAYQKRLEQYKLMNVNLVRVWGGGPLEKHSLYELCDKLGILVWQEFPLSSSNMDNWPPETESFINDIAEIAKDYIEKRSYHPSLLLWCGGNELQGDTDGSNIGIGLPVTDSHPCILRLKEVVEKYDGVRRFLPTSSSGPSFTALKCNYGKGIHHDIHGPWEMASEEEFNDYWKDDDSLLRSEVGVPAMACAESIEKYANSYDPLPSKENLYWAYRALQWSPVEELKVILGDWVENTKDLNLLVNCSQLLQADRYRRVIEKCRQRTWNNSGVILWMGHDLIHMPCNSSIIEHDGTPKYCCSLIAKAFEPLHVSVSLDSHFLSQETPTTGRFWLHNENSIIKESMFWEISACNMNGSVLFNKKGLVLVKNQENILVDEFTLNAESNFTDIMFLRLIAHNGSVLTSNDYLLFSKENCSDFIKLKDLENAKVNARFVNNQEGSFIEVQNSGSIVALGCFLPKEMSMSMPELPFVLLPSETKLIKIGDLKEDICFDGKQLQGINWNSKISLYPFGHIKDYASQNV